MSHPGIDSRRSGFVHCRWLRREIAVLIGRQYAVRNVLGDRVGVVRNVYALSLEPRDDLLTVLSDLIGDGVDEDLFVEGVPALPGIDHFVGNILRHGKPVVLDADSAPFEPFENLLACQIRLCSDFVNMHRFSFVSN